MNCSVKSFRCMDFLLPSQIGHGNIRNPPHLPQTVVTVKLCNQKLVGILRKLLYFENTPTPWLMLLLVLGKSRVKQNSC